MAQEIRAVIIVEIMGRPAEHVKESLKNHVEKIDEMKGVHVISISLSEPQEIEQRKDFYTCFAEIELEAESFLHLTNVVFDYMPSSVEIIKPDEVGFNIADASSFLNTLAGRLHSYDEIAKICKLQNQQLMKKLEGEGVRQVIQGGKGKVVSSGWKKEKKNGGEVGQEKTEKKMQILLDKLSKF